MTCVKCSHILYLILHESLHPSIANGERATCASTPAYLTTCITRCKLYRRSLPWGLLSHECKALIGWTSTLATDTLEAYSSRRNLMDTTSQLATVQDFKQMHIRTKLITKKLSAFLGLTTSAPIPWKSLLYIMDRPRWAKMNTKLRKFYKEADPIAPSFVWKEALRRSSLWE